MRKGIIKGAILIGLPLFTSLIVWLFGRYNLSLSEVLDIIYRSLRFQEPSNQVGYMIVMQIRLPRILMAMIAGAGLSVAGLAFQSMFSNPLTTPDILGVSSGSAFGAALGILLGFGLFEIQITSLALGLFAMLITYHLATNNKNTSIIMLILSGIVVTSIFNALLSLVKFVADPQSKLPAITFWLMGSLHNMSYKILIYFSPTILCAIILLYLLRWKLNILALPQDEAKSLGLNVKQLRLIVILCGSVITASIVAVCGMIGWVGLLIPHISRMVFGNDFKNVLPASISFGATFMVLVDTFARSMLSSEIPLGILCSILGAPIFLLLLKKDGGKFI